jgi:hypothetical protein
VSVAVSRKQGKQVQCGGYCGAVSREISVMHNEHAAEKVTGCSREASCNRTSRVHASGCKEVARQGGTDQGPTTSWRQGGGWQAGARGLDRVAEHVCDTFIGWSEAG